MPNNILITPGSASIQFSGSAANTIRLQVEASGSIAFYGNSGSLFGISDVLSGSLMSVNDISGLPILEVFSDDRVVMGSFNKNTLVVTGSRIGIDKAVPTADLDISGSVFITGSLTMNSGGITGSLLGTASLATSASFSTTSSFASTAQTLLGSVTSASYAATASLLLGSVVSASFATTASFAVSASYAPGGSGLTGGTANYIPVWTSATAQSSSVIYQSSSRNIIIGNTASKHPSNPPLLEINNADGETEALHLHGQVNNSYQFNIKNFTTGNSASADIIITADAGVPLQNNYVSLGINSSAHADSGSVGNALDAYLYNTGSDLLIGNISPDKKIILFNGGLRADDNARVYIDATGSVGINTSTPTAGNPEALIVRALTDSYNLITAEASINNYAQINVKNITSGNSASSDIVATANNGSETTNFIDMGINSDVYGIVNVVGSPNDAYIYSTGNDLLIGNATAAKNVVLFTGGANVTTNQKLVLASNNAHILTGSLQLSGAVTASVFGTASWATNATLLNGTSSAIFANTGSNTFVGNQVVTGSLVLSSSAAVELTVIGNSALTGSLNVTAGITGSLLGTASIATTALTASSFTGYLTFPNGLDITGSTVMTGSGYVLQVLGSASVANNLLVNGGTLFVDAANNRVAINTTGSISNTLHVQGTVSASSYTSSISSAVGFLGTASWASNSISSSFSTTSSFASTAQTLLGSVTSASYAATASLLLGSVESASYAATASVAISASYAANAGTSGLKTKAGSIANTAFTGNPRKAPVNFTAPFANTNYAIVITGEDARSWTYEGKVVGGFTASANSNTALAGTTTWIATAYGET